MEYLSCLVFSEVSGSVAGVWYQFGGKFRSLLFQIVLLFISQGKGVGLESSSVNTQCDRSTLCLGS